MSEVQDQLKLQVREYWNEQPCGTQFGTGERFSREYFDEIERVRYEREPEIFAFAQFTRHHGQKVLEVGTGAGSDFTQWVRAGARAHGIDQTPQGVEHVRERLALYGLSAEDVRVADAENLPFEDGVFDVVYSWGVIHHSPNTERALEEIVRVCRPGGVGKVMIYNRHSILSYFFWVKHALLKGRPWKSLAWVLWHHMESIGTKAYTVDEARRMLARMPVTNVEVGTYLSFYDRMDRHHPLLRAAARVTTALLGRRNTGWFLTMKFERV
jgi:ubiquinone/menaquinone biosynthesis C-methylase UbiE